MTWNYFIIFAIISVVCWIIGAIASWKEKKTLTFVFTSLGLAVFFSYILLMWITLERPPLRTMGETRLWYSFFLPLAGIIVYSRWHYRWILSFSTLLATVFVCINLFKPEIHSKTLMPALQSPWFAPHVIVYMMAYAMLGAAMVMAVYLLFIKKTAATAQELDITDNLVYVGMSFVTLGMLMGALWAKHGDTIGVGTQKKHGLPSHGCLIWFTFTIVSINPCAPNPLSSCLLSVSVYYKCVGGASTICRRPKESAYIHTA